MAISSDDIKKIGALARLKLTEAEAAAYRKDFSGILRYVDQLRSVRLPLGKAQGPAAATRLRADKVSAWPLDERDGALRQAGKRSDGQLKVKRIL